MKKIVLFMLCALLLPLAAHADSDTLRDLGTTAAPGEIPKWDGAQWRAAHDNVGLEWPYFHCGEAITVGSVVYLNECNGMVYRAKADSRHTMPAVGIATTSASSGDVARVQLHGVANMPDLVPLAVYYLSADEAGALTPIAPVGHNVQRFGYALDNNRLLIQVGSTFEEASRSTEFGDGSDGGLNLTSGISYLSGNRVYNYASVYIGSDATITTADQNKPIIILSQGDVIIEGDIDLNGKGGIGGTAPADGGVTQPANGWGLGRYRHRGFTSSHSATSHANGQDGGGAGMRVAGGNGRNNTDSGGEQVFVSINYLNRAQIVLGSGGGAGTRGRWNYTNRSGGSGGHGGGGILIVAGGEIIVSGSITCNGNNGAAGTAGDGAGGSGGCVVLYAREGITNTGTITANSGTSAGAAGASSAGFVFLLNRTDWVNGMY